jgi:protease I
MTKRLAGRKIAILATDGVERIELTEPRRALEEAGATVELLAPAAGSILSMDHLERRDPLSVDRRVSEAAPQDYDGLVLPGGVVNADKLRADPGAVRFVRAFFESGGPIGVICHGAWILIETGLLRGRTLTSYPTMRTDIENAGARWVDEQVRDDDGLMSSRRPGDLPAFTAKIVEEFAKDRGARRAH